MIKVNAIVSDFEQLLTVAPPYESPGTTRWTSIMSGAGCDCSGVFTADFAYHGGSIYHGSNTIARKYLTSREKLTKASQLTVGMAVFKWQPSGEPAKYNSDGLGNFHHIGLVASVSPLRIIHQSSAAGHTACDTSIKSWQYCGLLKGIKYDDNVPKQEQSQQEESGMYKIKVNTKSLRIRAEASTDSAVLGSLPMGTVTNASELTGGWFKLADSDGWVSAQYCVILQQYAAPADDPDQDDADSSTDTDQMQEILDRLDAIERRLDALEG